MRTQLWIVAGARVACTTLLALCVCGSGRAATVFSGDFSDWAPDGPNPEVYDDPEADGGATLEWGDPANFGTGPSHITYSPYHVSTDAVLSGQVFDMGHLTYFNGTILLGTGITSAVLILDISSDDETLNSAAGFAEIMFTESTPNVGTPAQNADYVFFSNFHDDDIANRFFNVFEGSTASADVLARLDFVPISQNQLVAAANPDGEYRLALLGFDNVQGGGFLTHDPVVPEPGTVTVVLLSAVGLLATSLRRRKSAGA